MLKRYGIIARNYTRSAKVITADNTSRRSVRCIRLKFERLINSRSRLIPSGMSLPRFSTIPSVARLYRETERVSERASERKTENKENTVTRPVPEINVRKFIPTVS